MILHLKKKGDHMDETMKLEPLTWNPDRRFGAELEINAFDGKNRPDPPAILPSGIDEVGDLVSDTLNTPATVMTWHHTHNNENWIIKPDSSCGMEVCSPILKGWNGLSDVVRLSKQFREHDKIQSDGRCSFHIHVNIYDCSPAETASIVAHWIKCEMVFMDSVPPNRKRSRYCQVAGLSDLFNLKERISSRTILEKMGNSKYFSLNNFHYSKEKRATIEFRIAENEACTDPFFVKNWTRLVTHFCDRAKLLPIPGRYEPGNPWSSFCWLDPKDVFTLLGFAPKQYDLSPALQQTRNWFLARLKKYTYNTGLPGVFSNVGRKHAWAELQDLLQAFEKEGTVINEECLHPLAAREDDALFHKRYRL